MDEVFFERLPQVEEGAMRALRLMRRGGKRPKKRVHDI